MYQIIMNLIVSKIVYTIGGVRHTSKVLNFTVNMQDVEVYMSTITQCTANINWKYPKDVDVDSNFEEVRIYTKTQ